MTVGMSPHDITVRLRRVSQLRRLCLALARSRPLAPPTVEPIKEAPRDDEPP